MGKSNKPSSTPPPSGPSSSGPSNLTTLDAYLLIKVPDFGDTQFVNASEAADDGVDPSGINPTMLQSFLRLGAFDYASEPPAAKELLKVIPKANPAVNPAHDALNQENPLVPYPMTELLPGEQGRIFIDDIRVRPQDAGLTSDDDSQGHGLSLADRQAESAKLYSRGGWRDHSDGNRISTTWGDKVEVVRGNYKMIVLGRQNDPGNAMGWEASGAHIQDYAPGTMPGASFWLEWIDDARYHAPADPVGDERKGAWLLVNTTENVYEYARNAGNFREEVWGDVNESYVGSENPPSGAFATDDTHGTQGHEPPHRLAGRNYDLPGGKLARTTPPWNLDNKGAVRSNPHIIEKTWAERIDSWTGSSARRVPKIVEKTWAEDTEAYTNISGTVTETTVVGGTVTTTTTVTGAVTEATTIAGANTAATTVAGANSEASTVGGANTAVSIVAGLNTSIDIAIAGIEIGVTGGKLGVDVSGIAIGIEAYLGKIDIALGLGALGLDLFAGKYEWTIGKSGEYKFPDDDEKRLKKIETTLEKTASSLRYQIDTTAFNIAALQIQIMGKVSLGSG